MSEPNTKDPVSHSHARPTKPKIIGNFPGNLERTVKKNQLQQAIGEFSANEKESGGKKESLLSDEDSVLHVGKEKRGTIITDTKRRRWRFTNAVKKAFGGWLSNKKQHVEKVLTKPEPKKIVAASHTRVETIKQAAKGGALADTDGLKVVRPTKPTKRNVRSSIRIKPKDVPTEIGETKPRWTHMVEDETLPPTPTATNAPASQATKSVPEDDVDIELIEAPEKHLLLPAHPAVTPMNVKKTFRTPRVVHSVTSLPRSIPKEEREPQMASTKVFETTPQQPSAPATQTTPVSDTHGEPEVTSQSKVSARTDKPTSVSPLPNIERVPDPKPNSTIITGNTLTMLLAIALVAILAISTTLWNLRTPETTIEWGASTHSIPLDTKAMPMDMKGTGIAASLKDALASNSGFIDVTPTDADAFLQALRLWGGIFERDTIAAAVGGFNDRPFVIVKTNSQEIGLAGMYAFEKNIPSDLTALYGVPSSARFITKKISNDEARVLIMGSGERLTYTVRTDGTVLITQTSDDLAALIDAIK